jgi:hypothetical protein
MVHILLNSPAAQTCQAKPEAGRGPVMHPAPQAVEAWLLRNCSTASVET